MKKFEKGLFIGRFQPFHKGHLSALKRAISLCNKVVVGIGSSQEKETERNPLASKERIKIIKAALKGTRIDMRKLSFIEVPDFHDNDKWFNYITEREPGIDVVFSRHWLVKKIFRERDIAVISPPWLERRRLMASRIRKMIRSGKKEWRPRVPKGAIAEIAAHEKEFG